MVDYYTVIDSEEKLLNVVGIYWEEKKLNCEALELVFENNCILITANPDDDSLLLAYSRVQVDFLGMFESNLSNSDLWRDCIGKPLRWCWEMENHQGYRDGIQFEFYNQDIGFEKKIQIIGICSGVTQFEVVSYSGVGDKIL